INGQLFLGRTGNAAGVGPMPVPGPDGGSRRLIDVASLSVLATAMDAAGVPSDHLWHQHADWLVPEPLLAPWIDAAAQGLAYATLAAASLLELEAVLIDGWMPETVRARIVARTDEALHRLDLAGVAAPVIRAGSVGADARALGAAAIPLSQRYLLDQNAPVRERT
ncbi:MAG: sugar kinase, partial [Paracoccaceae bacterium]